MIPNALRVVGMRDDMLNFALWIANGKETHARSIGASHHQGPFKMPDHATRDQINVVALYAASVALNRAWIDLVNPTYQARAAGFDIEGCIVKGVPICTHGLIIETDTNRRLDCPWVLVYVNPKNLHDCWILGWEFGSNVRARPLCSWLPRPGHHVGPTQLRRPEGLIL